MASDVEKRIAKALLSARSHIGSCRPDYDEDDAAWWDELTELAELVTQPAASGEVVAWRYLKPLGCATYAWTRWLGMDELHHYGEDGNLIAGPHPDWKIEYAYASTQPDADTVRDAARAEAIRRCAISYLGMLGVKNPEQALDEDIRDPDMCGDAAIDSAIKGEK